MADKIIARIHLAKQTVLAAEHAEIVATSARRRIQGLDNVPTFDQHVQECPAPPGFQRTQSGLLVPISPGSAITQPRKP